MIRPASVALAAVLGLALTPAHAADPTPDFAAAIDRAITGERLIQAEAMLGRADITLPAPDRGRLEASLLLGMRRDAEALKRFEALLAEQPNDCRLQAGAGIAAMRLDRPKDAEPRLLAATTACPRDAKAWGALAVLEDKAGQWDRSADAYAHAIAVTRDDPALLNNAGVSLMRQKRFAEAVRLFQQVLLLDPGNERARNNLDIARVAGGERPSFDTEENSRQRAERLNNAGYAALLAGDDAAATQYFADAIKTNPFTFGTAEANLQDASANTQGTP
jgi:Flp pilus assembly protein TadD